MPRIMEEEIVGWRLELGDLEEAIVRGDPPLDPRTRP
jgi:hypothetical protein